MSSARCAQDCRIRRVSPDLVTVCARIRGGLSGILLLRPDYLASPQGQQAVRALLAEYEQLCAQALNALYPPTNQPARGGGV